MVRDINVAVGIDLHYISTYMPSEKFNENMRFFAGCRMTDKITLFDVYQQTFSVILRTQV
jgi:hypothetical protein